MFSLNVRKTSLREAKPKITGTKIPAQVYPHFLMQIPRLRHAESNSSQDMTIVSCRCNPCYPCIRTCAGAGTPRIPLHMLFDVSVYTETTCVGGFAGWSVFTDSKQTEHGSTPFLAKCGLLCKHVIWEIFVLHISRRYVIHIGCAEECGKYLIIWHTYWVRVQKKFTKMYLILWYQKCKESRYNIRYNILECKNWDSY